MVQFNINLAGVPIGISTLYEQTQDDYRPYWASKPPAFSLTSTEQYLAQERTLTAQHKARHPHTGIYPRNDAELEQQWLYHQIGERMPEYGVLLFHGSAVAVDGEAYLFTAPSGTGKSTHTRLWRQYFGPRAVMINDDKPLLKISETGIQAYGTPWRGKHRLGSNRSAPLKAICLLIRSPSNWITPISPGDAFPTLLQQCYKPEIPSHTLQTLALLEQLSQNVSLYRLGCNMDPDAAQISYEGMQGGQK